MKHAAMVLLAVSVGVGAEAGEKPVVKRVNPAALFKSSAYTHVVEVSGGRTLYVSGQVALDREGNLVGQGDLKAQARQVFENMKAALAACGGTLDDVVKITVFMTDVSEIQAFREVRGLYFTREPPGSTLVQVVRLARPEFMLEVEAVAVVE